MSNTVVIKQSNGRGIVTRLHTSKRGKVYKRRRVVSRIPYIVIPSWFR